MGGLSDLEKMASEDTTEQQHQLVSRILREARWFVQSSDLDEWDVLEAMREAESAIIEAIREATQ